MLAYLDNPALKAHVLDQLAQHRAADCLVKGRYWEDGKGCAVGCTLESVRVFNGHAHDEIDHASHALYETELGIPAIIARLEDSFFERLENGTSQTWPERFTKAIRVGADLTMVWPRFAYWLLTEEGPQHTKNKRSLALLADVASLYREWIDGKKPTTERWLKAKNAAAAAYADAAADAAAYAAAYAAYADAAADAAAYAAAYAAYADAYAAAAYADAYADRQASIVRQANKLIELLEAA